MYWLSKRGQNHTLCYKSLWRGGSVEMFFLIMNSSMVARAQWKSVRVSGTLGKTFAQMISYQLMIYFSSFFCCVGGFLCAPHQTFFPALRLFQDGDIPALWWGGESKLFVFFKSGVEGVKVRGRCVKCEPISCCWGFNRCHFSLRWREKWSAFEAAQGGKNLSAFGLWL